MNDQQIRAGVIALFKTIGQKLDDVELDADAALRGQLDLDSMDWLNVVVGLHERFKIDIPESDYGKLATLNAIVAYLGARLKT